MALESLSQLYVCHFVAQGILHGFQQILAFFCLFFSLLLFFCRFAQIQIICGNRFEFLFIVGVEYLKCEFVDIVRQIQDLVALVL